MMSCGQKMELLEWHYETSSLKCFACCRGGLHNRCWSVKVESSVNKTPAFTLLTLDVVKNLFPRCWSDTSVELLSWFLALYPLCRTHQQLQPFCRVWEQVSWALSYREQTANSFLHIWCLSVNKGSKFKVFSGINSQLP